MRNTIVKTSFLAVVAVTLLALSALFAGTAQANLIAGGDFTGVTVQDSNLSPSSGPFGVWLGQPANLHVVNDGQGIGGNNDYLKHIQNTVRLFQGLSINPGELPAGSNLTLSFDYIYESGFTGINQSSVRVLGLKNTDGIINRFLFPGDGFPTGDILTQEALPHLENNWSHFSRSFHIPENYDAIAVVFTAGAFGSNTTGLRGLDNVDLSTGNNNTVPEPSLLLLLGAGTVGIGLLRRRIMG
jgi:hypothetical protein